MFCLRNIEECIQDDIITVGLRNGVSGETTCDHEKLLTVGLKGYIVSAKPISLRLFVSVRKMKRRLITGRLVLFSARA